MTHRRPIGPYSPAIRTGQLLFVSGQVPLDPATGNLVTGDIAAETRQVMENIGALLKAGGLDFSAVVRTTVFLADMNDFAGDERRVRRVLRRAVSGAGDGAGRTAAAGRAHRDRRDRELTTRR